MTDNDQVILHFANGPARCKCIHIWRRTDGLQIMMSNSSGMKDMTRNLALSVMEARPQVTAVAYMRIPMPHLVMFLYQIRGQWVDKDGRWARPEVVNDAEEAAV